MGVRWYSNKSFEVSQQGDIMRIGFVLSWCISSIEEIDADTDAGIDEDFNEGYRAALDDLLLLIYSEAMEEADKTGKEAMH